MGNLESTHGPGRAGLESLARMPIGRKSQASGLTPPWQTREYLVGTAMAGMRGLERIRCLRLLALQELE